MEKIPHPISPLEILLETSIKELDLTMTWAEEDGLASNFVTLFLRVTYEATRRRETACPGVS